jgi:dTMP kinase
VDPGVGLGRVDHRGEGADRLESESKAFHERVRYAFLDLAATDPKRYLVLDAARPAGDITDAVSERLSGLLHTMDAAYPETAPTPSATATSSAAPEAPAAAPAGGAAPAPVQEGEALEEMAEVSGVEDEKPDRR